MRIAIGIEYDGTAYNGWQRQRTGLGVGAAGTGDLDRFVSDDGERTLQPLLDAGVHASGQVAHFDTHAERSERGWLLGANTNLPDDICVTWVKPVADDFHARFSATARRYRYRILNRLVRSALYRRRAWWVHQDLDHLRMHEAAQALLGEHDFSAFRAAGCQASNAVREVTAISVVREGDWVLLDITANAFLQHMVRNIAGTLVAIGSGDQEVGWAARVLGDRDRTRAGMAAPPHGLTLVQVCYPDAFDIPAPVALGQ